MTTQTSSDRAFYPTSPPLTANGVSRSGAVTVRQAFARLILTAGEAGYVDVESWRLIEPVDELQPNYFLEMPDPAYGIDGEPRRMCTLLGQGRSRSVTTLSAICSVLMYDNRFQAHRHKSESWRQTRAQRDQDRNVDRGEVHQARGPRLNTADVIAVKRALASGEDRDVIAKRHNVSRKAISDIATGYTWSRVTVPE